MRAGPPGRTRDEQPSTTPTGALVPAQTPSESAMPSIRGWKERITTYCEERGIVRSQGQVKALAYRIAKRAAKMQYVDPDELIRYCLDYLDPTGEQAVHHVMAESAA
jgi:hypothetical protein